MATVGQLIRSLSQFPADWPVFFTPELHCSEGYPVWLECSVQRVEQYDDDDERVQLEVVEVSLMSESDDVPA